VIKKIVFDGVDVILGTIVAWLYRDRAGKGEIPLSGAMLAARTAMRATRKTRR